MARIWVAILAVVVWAASAAAADAVKTAAAATFNLAPAWGGVLFGPWPAAIVLTWLAALTLRHGPHSKEQIMRSRVVEAVLVILGLFIAATPFIAAMGWIVPMLRGWDSVVRFNWVGAMMASIGLWGLFAHRVRA